MPKKIILRTGVYPYHLMSRTNNKDWFRLPISSVWEIFADKCNAITEAYGFEIHTFVLMQNHFHMLATTPRANMDDGMCYLLREVSKEINRQTNRINHVFGGPYKWTSIQTELYFSHAYKYVFQNPLRANAVTRVENYPFSSIHNELGRKCQIQIKPPIQGFNRLIPNNSLELLNWLNTPPANVHDIDLVTRALRKGVFQFSEKRLRDYSSSLGTCTM